MRTSLLLTAVVAVVSCHLADEKEPPKCPEGFHPLNDRCVQDQTSTTVASIGKDCQLAPEPFRVRARSDFQFKNDDDVAHGVTALDGKLSEQVNPGKLSRAVVISTPGSYPYEVSNCPTGSVRGTLVVE